MRLTLLLLIILALMTRMVVTRPPAQGYCLADDVPRLPTEDGLQLSKCVLLTNVPRSGSTWFLNVLIDHYGQHTDYIDVLSTTTTSPFKVAVRGTHYPFFNQSHIPELSCGGDDDGTIILLVREPRNVWPSYEKIFTIRSMTYEAFLERYEAHNEWWRRRYGDSLVEIQYEWFERPRGIEEAPFAAQLWNSYKSYAHRAWI